MAEVVSIKKYIGFEKGKAPKETFDFPADGLMPYLSPEYLRGTGNPLYVKPNNKLVSIDEGELIILWDGSNAGEVFVSKKGVLGSTMTKIVFDENEFDKAYFTYALKYNEYFLKAKTAGSGIPHVDKGIVKKIEVFKPEPAEQRTIASILSKVDEAITATKNSIAKAERLKKALMQNLLTGKLKPDGTWRKEDEFYKDEKFGNVPIGWVVKPVGDKSVCQLNPNYKFIKGEEYPFLPMEAINDKFNGINYFERRKVDTSSGYARFKNGDILFAKITPCTENGKVAFVEKLNSDIGFASTEFIVLSPSENIDQKFLYYRVINGDVHRLAVSLMEGTTGRQRVPAKVFRNRIFIALPSDKEEQRIIAEKIGSVDNHFLSKQTKIQKLERLKKSLMQNLLTGKVRVKVPKEQLQTETQ